MNNKKVISVFIIVIIIILALFGYFIFYSINSKKINNTTNNTGISINVTETETNDLLNIINNELYVINKYKSIKDITNTDKLYISFIKLNKENYLSYTIDEIEYKICYSGIDITNSFNNSSLSNTDIKNSSFKISNYNITYIDTENIYCINTSLIDDIYKYNIAYHLESISKKLGTYTVKVKFLFSKNPNIYGSYIDMEKDNKVIDNKNNIVNIDAYLKANYDILKDKLQTYTYIFTKENAKYYLKDYYYE